MAQQDGSTQEFLFDRSRLERYQRCPRAWYWGYGYKGLGVALPARPLPLAFGGAVHKALEVLLRSQDVTGAVEAGILDFEQTARTKGFELNANENQHAVFLEHRALLEALVRAWALVRLPSFLEEYDVVDLEREEEWVAAEGLLFMARADGVLRQRATGDLYILSFKTTKQWARARDYEARTDIQGISELVAVEERLGERVQGIQMEYLVKGTRLEWPKGSGIYQINNPLIRPWVGGPDGMRYAHSWDWQDADGNHTLGSKYRKVPIWETMPIADWIDKLWSGQVQPEAGQPLERYIVSPLPYLRNRDEIESWKRQARQQAGDISLAQGVVETYRETEHSRFLDVLDERFPQYRHSCNYPTPCQFKDICFGPCGPEPEASGRYVFREPHHELEQQRLEEGDLDGQQTGRTVAGA